MGNQCMPQKRAKKDKLEDIVLRLRELKNTLHQNQFEMEDRLTQFSAHVKHYETKRERSSVKSTSSNLHQSEVEVFVNKSGASGLGIRFARVKVPGEPDYMMISAVLDRTTCKDLKVGDRLLDLNGQQVSGLSVDELSHLIDQTPSPVYLRLQRTRSVLRDDVQISNVPRSERTRAADAPSSPKTAHPTMESKLIRHWMQDPISNKTTGGWFDNEEDEEISRKPIPRGSLPHNFKLTTPLKENAREGKPALTIENNGVVSPRSSGGLDC